MKNLLSLLSLGLVVGAAGCGQTSYFEVDVRVQNTVAGLMDPFCLSRMNTCEVTVSGADSAFFALTGDVCRMPTRFALGKFQFATDKDSGTMMFHINIFDGNLKKLGQGDVSSTIKAGGRQTATLEITPDAVAFACVSP